MANLVPMAGLQVLLLTTTGRKTGQVRTSPLGFFKHGDKFVVIALNGGSDRSPAWFYNLKSNPQVMIQVGNKQLTAKAEVAHPELRKQLWAELVKMAPRYEKYAQGTKREIPLALLEWPWLRCGSIGPPVAAAAISPSGGSVACRRWQGMGIRFVSLLQKSEGHEYEKAGTKHAASPPLAL
jgi:F420H(2)-dependent quinone reductase